MASITQKTEKKEYRFFVWTIILYLMPARMNPRQNDLVGLAFGRV